MTRENKILVKNKTQQRIVLTLEPWAEQYNLHPGVLVELRQAIYEEIGNLEIEYCDASITVYSGGIVAVFCDGKELSPVNPWIDNPT